MKDLPKFKAGDRVWHLLIEKWGILENIQSPSDHLKLHLFIDNCNYYFTVEGKYREEDVNPVIFHTEQTLNFEKPKWIPKEGEFCFFWDDENINKVDAIRFEHYTENREYPYLTKIGTPYKYCCPITEIPPHLL